MKWLAAMLCASGLSAAAAEPGSWLKKITSHPLAVTAPRLVSQRPEQLYESHLPPVWVAAVDRGYVMWEAEAPGKLVEFSLGEVVRGSHLIAGVPNLQQFPVPGKTAAAAASGCVPTSAANLVAYWGAHGLSGWAGVEPRAIALRLRALIPMTEFPDVGGYTEDGSPLSGAAPEDLAAALRADAATHGVKVRVELEDFEAAALQREIAAERPVLLSAVVRLPHQPQLSWGHEVTGIGWAEIAGELFVAVRDNFYPGSDAATIRWLRADAFDRLLTVIPLP